jgi:hypothetical protein
MMYMALGIAALLLSVWAGRYAGRGRSGPAIRNKKQPVRMDRAQRRFTEELAVASVSAKAIRHEIALETARKRAKPHSTTKGAGETNSLSSDSVLSR